MEPLKKTRPWTAMTGQQKFGFVCKVVVSIISFGFIFPNIMND
jgi:hypothetical protein